MQKNLWLLGLALMMGLTGCGGGSSSNSASATPPNSDVTDTASAILGSDLVPPSVNAELESGLIPDATASTTDSFPAELKPPIS